MSDKKKIIDGLINAYWAEMETVMNYISNSTNLDGVRAEEIKKALNAEVQDEIGHAQLIAKRVKELGGRIPGSKGMITTQETLQPSEDTTDVEYVIKGVIDAENSAIEGYNQLIKVCEGVDYVTQDLAITLLADEESHKTIFEGYLKEYKN
jgi:bacterioferritin